MWKETRPVRVRPQSLKLLSLLLSRPGELISREEIQRALWGDETFVDYEQGVNHSIKELRAALGDVAESPRFIQTLPRRGYRFIAPVERIGETKWRPVWRAEAPSRSASRHGGRRRSACGDDPEATDAAIARSIGAGVGCRCRHRRCRAQRSACNGYSANDTTWIAPR